MRTMDYEEIIRGEVAGDLQTNSDDTSVNRKTAKTIGSD